MTDNVDKLAAPTDNLRYRVATSVAFVGTAQAVRVAVQFVSVIVMSRLLTPMDFGVMAMISPLIAFVMLLQGMGLASAIANARDVTHAQLSTVFWINVGISAVLAVLVACAAPLVGRFYSEPATVGPTLAMAGLVLVSGLGSQHTALINRQMRFQRTAIVDAASSVLSLAAGIGVAMVWPSPWALVSSLIVGSLISMVGAWWVSQWRPGRPSSLRDVGTFLRFGRGVTGFHLANFLARNLDNVLIGRYAGTMELGFYDRAYKLLLFPLQQINWPVSRVLTPVLSRLAHEPDRYRSAYTRVVQQILLATVPGVVCLLVNAATAIPTVLGEQWVPTVPIFMWLGFSALIQPMSATTGWLFISQHRTDEFALWGIFVAATCIGAFIVGLPWGAVGVAAAYTLSEIFVRLPVVLWLVGRRGPVSTRHLCALAAPNIVANGVAASVLLLLPSNVGLSPVPDLLARLTLAYAVCWSVLALFPAGRRAFAESLKTVSALRA
jgi:polysaccharide transporter, PST family